MEVYKQTFKNGDVTFFKPEKKLKNGRYKGLLLDSGAGGRSKKKPVQKTVDLSLPMWKKTESDEIPDIFKESYSEVNFKSWKDLVE